MNSNILELGCGCCALPGQVASILGSNVTLTDVSNEIPQILENIELNSSFHKHPINVIELDWFNIFLKKSFPTNFNPCEYDIIICADVVYELTFLPFMYTISLFLQYNPNMIILMSNEGRKHVHIFRRKMLCICNFQEISHPTDEYGHCISWLIKLKENPNWETLWSIFE